MKTKHIILILLCLFIGANTDAQLFKKLKEKIANKASGKNEEKQSAETDTLSKNTMGNSIPAPADNNVKLPDSYQFSYYAIMQVKNSQGTVETEYYLQPHENYFAKKQITDSITEYVVYDNQLNMEVHFAEIKGEKKSIRKKMDIFTKVKMLGAYRDAPNRKVKSIGNKTLLGYNCKGYEISTEAGTTQLWITNEAPATMYSALFAPRADEPNSPFSKNTMIMEASFTSAQKPDNNYHMQFTKLQTNTLVFNNDDYKE